MLETMELPVHTLYLFLNFQHFLYHKSRQDRAVCFVMLQGQLKQHKNNTMMKVSSQSVSQWCHFLYRGYSLSWKISYLSEHRSCWQSCQIWLAHRDVCNEWCSSSAFPTTRNKKKKKKLKPQPCFIEWKCLH